MHKVKLSGAAVLGLSMAACSGSAGTDWASTPPPTTTSYPALNGLTSEQKVSTSGYVLAVDDTGVKSLAQAAQDVVTITFQPATGTYLVKTPAAGSLSYGAPDALSGNAFAGPGFAYYGKTSVVNGTSVDDRVAIYRPQGGAGSAVPLTYTTLLVAVRQTTPGGFSTADLSFTFGGFATAAADMPKSGTASYNGPAYGQYYRNSTFERELVDGSLAVTANFATSSLDTRIQLYRGGFPMLDLAGAGTISSNLFEGVLAGKGYSGATMTGRYAGQFMGPGAAELGLRFDVTDGSGSIVGVGAARK